MSYIGYSKDVWSGTAKNKPKYTNKGKEWGGCVSAFSLPPHLLALFLYFGLFLTVPLQASLGYPICTSINQSSASAWKNIENKLQLFSKLHFACICCSEKVWLTHSLANTLSIFWASSRLAEAIFAWFLSNAACSLCSCSWAFLISFNSFHTSFSPCLEKGHLQ